MWVKPLRTTPACQMNPSTPCSRWRAFHLLLERGALALKVLLGKSTSQPAGQPTAQARERDTERDTAGARPRRFQRMRR